MIGICGNELIYLTVCLVIKVYVVYSVDIIFEHGKGTVLSA